MGLDPDKYPLVVSSFPVFLKFKIRVVCTSPKMRVVSKDRSQTVR
jgi:hypothetical protein